ncbi:MAG: ATP-binding protein, partial [Gammaproteobacteria bacterium]
IQECLTTIVRHAQASQATITLRIDRQPERRLQLEVRDNGRGCAADNMKSGFGLLGMRERVDSLGGEFLIDTHRPQGMSIHASVPLS